MDSNFTSGILCFDAQGDLAVDTDEVGENSGGTIIFLAVAVGIGALVRHILKNTILPYTVILMVVGLLIGLATNSSTLSFLHEYTTISNINPRLMLLTFLPTLIFESAFVLDVHIFKKTIFQALILACPGLIVSAVLIAILARYVFTYNWSWVTAMLFGSIFSATDPVSVVALLKDLGTSKQLGTVIEGESLLNDGIAIVIFNIFLDELIPGQSRSPLGIFVYLIQVGLGGPLFGYIMARLTIWWLSRVFNDAVVEITITLASTYFTYYVGDELLGVSGVLAVVTLGVEINARKTSISPEVEAFLLKFWGMLSYLANTLIFVLVGVVIAQRAFSGVANNDWIALISLYFALNVTRLLMVVGLSPLLAHTGYSLDWKNMLVITWSGLRGAVGLALALVVEQTPGIPRDTIGSKVLFLTAGIVILTLLINATTIKYLLQTLGLSDISNARRLTMVTAIRRIHEAKLKAMRLLKSDRFLADSHWDVVDRQTVVDNPFDSEDEANEEQDAHQRGIIPTDMESHCPDCRRKVARVPNPKELAELAEDMRARIIRTEKTSYWKQYREGMLDREAVVVLSNIADTVTDTPFRFIELKDIEAYWKVPSYLSRIRRWLVKVQTSKSSIPPPPKDYGGKITHRLVTKPFFEWMIFCVVLVDIVLISVQLSIEESTLSTLIFRYINCVIVGVYTSEAILKLIGLRLNYFWSLFNDFDVFLLFLSWSDIILEILSVSDIQFAIRIFTILRIIRVLRFIKILKLVVPIGIRLVQLRINHLVRLGYGIGKGFVVGEEDVLQQFDRIASDVHKGIGHKLRKKVDSSRLDVIRCLGLMQKEYPGVALSVKTRQAIRAVMNHCTSTFDHLKEGGILEEHDAEILQQAIEAKLKRLQRYPVSLPRPDPYSILQNHPWLSGLDSSVLCPLQDCAELMERPSGDVLLQSGEPPAGIFIIVAGLVKVITYKSVDRSHSSASSFNFDFVDGSRPRSGSEGAIWWSNQNSRKSSLMPPSTLSSGPVLYNEKTGSEIFFSQSARTAHVEAIDFCDVGNILGEIGILEQKVNEVDAICETDVQVFFIGRENVELLITEYPVLKDRMWKLLGVHMASSLLRELSEYQDWTINSLLLMLYEASHLLPQPTGSACVEIKNDWKQVIVISGAAEAIDSKEQLVAPCIVPPTVRHLLLCHPETKIMVVTCSRSGLPREYHEQTYRWTRRYKRSVKTFLVKIKKLLWVQYVSIKDLLSKALLECFDYLVNQCTRRNRVKSSASVATSTDEKRKLSFDLSTSFRMKRDSIFSKIQSHSEKKAVQINATPSSLPRRTLRQGKVPGLLLNKSNYRFVREPNGGSFSDPVIRHKFNAKDFLFEMDSLSLPRKSSIESQIKSHSNFGQNSWVKVKPTSFSEPRIKITFDSCDDAASKSKEPHALYQFAHSKHREINHLGGKGRRSFSVTEPLIKITLEGEDDFTHKQPHTALSSEVTDVKLDSETQTLVLADVEDPLIDLNPSESLRSAESLKGKKGRVSLTPLDFSGPEIKVSLEESSSQEAHFARPQHSSRAKRYLLRSNQATYQDSNTIDVLHSDSDELSPSSSTESKVFTSKRKPKGQRNRKRRHGGKPIRQESSEILLEDSQLKLKEECASKPDGIDSEISELSNSTETDRSETGFPFSRSWV